ncbi:MAG: hypothetical protein D6796_12235 [Caldilineae bacterium]|nr:MAG: hypothetical protein D6796_12235 [Caldilineae bacterium]
MNHLRSRSGWFLGLWALAMLVAGFGGWFPARAAAATLLLFFLPGWAWLEAWPAAPRRVLWRLVLAFSLSLSLTGLGTLYLAYLPGPLTKAHLAGLLAAITLPPVLIALRRRPQPLEWPAPKFWIPLLLLLLLAAGLRLPMLGYAEFHEDEVEVTSLAAQTLGGTDYAVFLHRKGPLQMLVPLSGWLAADRITEGWARFPFALASLMGLLAVALLVCRVAGPAAGLTAGLLLALNGYSLVFGRIVQYQSLVAVLGTVGLAALWLALEEGRAGLVWLASLGLAVSLLAHYDALLYLPVAAYLAWRIWQQHPAVRSTLIAAASVGVIIVLSFYIPYLRDPQFEHTRAYLVESRIGTDWLYNNLRTIHKWDRDYDSRFYLPVLWGLSAVVLWHYKPARRLWQAATILALATALSTIAWPAVWQVGLLNLALLPWLALLLIGAAALHRRHSGYEFFWLWWGVPLAGYAFLVDDPRTHIYIAYPGWAAVAGLGASILWRQVRLRSALLGLAGLWILLVGGYEVTLFQRTEPAFNRLRAEWGDSLYQTVYGGFPKLLPRARFGYPRRVGWKAAGWLMANGQLPADFRTVGEDFSVPIWYAFETPRSCYTDPDLYMIAQPLETLEEATRRQLADRYRPAGTIFADGEPRIRLFVKEADGPPPADYRLEDLAPRFDAAATPARFTQHNRPQMTLNARFGETATFTGFDLSGQRVKPGETLSVYLYWQSLAPSQTRYRVFVHLGENPVWSQHDDDPVCRLPTTEWRAGQQGRGHFRLVPPPDMPPGDYPLVIGLYNPDTFERLPIFDAAGQPVGDSLTLAVIEVVAP